MQWVVFLLFALVIPILHLLLLCCIWCAPVTLAMQRNLFVASEVLNAWGSMDVFIIAVIAALLQLRQFAAFIVGGRCDALNQFMGRYLAQVLTEPDERQCFSVIASLEEGAWYLLAAGISTVLVGQLVTRLCEYSLEDRTSRQGSNNGGGESQARSRLARK